MTGYGIRDRLWQKQLAAVGEDTAGAHGPTTHGSSVLLSACCLLLFVSAILQKNTEKILVEKLPLWT